MSLSKLAGSDLKETATSDNRLKAIIAMNLCVFGGAASSVLFKLAAAEGARVLDFELLKGISIISCAFVQCRCQKISPISSFPWSELKWTLFWRCLSGMLTFCLFNFSLSLMPLTFQIIIFQTGTFWISIIAHFAFNEKIAPVEIIAMVICFANMVTVSVLGS